MLLGGLFMLVALILMMGIITPWARRVGTVLGGIGFGLFIDELGKFITSDNDYFFQPTIALIYIIFILIYLVTRRYLRVGTFSSAEYLANALESLKEATIRRLDERGKNKALEMLKRADPDDPLVAPLSALIEQAQARPWLPPHRGARWLIGIRNAYLRWVKTETFVRIMTFVFILLALYSSADLLHLGVAVVQALSKNSAPASEVVERTVRQHSLSLFTWISMLSGAATAVLMVIGVTHLRRDRLRAYRWFSLALWVYLFLGQVFAFARVQTLAIVNFLIALFLLISVRYMMVQERQR